MTTLAIDALGPGFALGVLITALVLFGLAVLVGRFCSLSNPPNEREARDDSWADYLDYLELRQAKVDRVRSDWERKAS